MDHSTEIRNPTLPQSQHNALNGGNGMIWGKIKLGIKRTLFWAYERGTWQYDLMVLAILAFIFVSPRTWFSDRPTLELTELRHQQFVEMGHEKQGWRYMIDLRLVESYAGTTPEDAVQMILGRQLPQPFTILSVDPITDKNKILLGYTVLVKRSDK